MVQTGPQRRMRKIGAKAPKGASPFPEILSYTPRKPRNSASLTPPWNGAVSGRKGMVVLAVCCEPVSADFPLRHPSARPWMSAPCSPPGVEPDRPRRALHPLSPTGMFRVQPRKRGVEIPSIYTHFFGQIDKAAEVNRMCPARACSHAASRASDSDWRPTNGVSPRATETSNRVIPAFKPSR